MRLILALLLCGVMPLNAQNIDLGLDLQTNAVVQLEHASDGTIWGITASSMDRLPTLAGVYTIRSVDDGATWDTSCVTQDWWRWGSELCAIDANHAWAATLRDDVTDTVEYYRTSDAGTTWSLVQPEDVGLARISNVHFFTPQVGVVVGSRGRAVTSKWTVSRTTDGGVTWTQSLDMQAYLNERVSSRNDRSTFHSGSWFGIGMTSGRILHTTDNGATWAFLMPPLGGAVSAIAKTATLGIVAVRTTKDGGFTAVKSSDGSSWDSVQLPPGTRDVHGMKVLKDGSLVTIPNDVNHAPLSIFSPDLSKGRTLKQHSCFGVMELPTGSLLTGTEVVPGKGLMLVAR